MVITRKKISIHIYNVFYSTIKIKKTHALKIVDNILYLIKKTINIYGKIIINNFGSFRLKEAKEKIGKNFHNKQKLFIAKRKKIFFQTSHRLKEILNSKGIDIKQKNYSTKLSNKLKLNYDFLSLEDAKKIVNSFFEFIILNISKNNQIIFNKYFSIEKKVYKPLKIWNPLKKENQYIQERCKPVFRFSKSMYLKS